MKVKLVWKILCIVLAVCLVGVLAASAVTAAQYQALKQRQSPYAIPEKYDIRTYFPDWDPSQGDPPRINKQVFNTVAYPEHWSVGQRVYWLHSKYNEAVTQIGNNNLAYFTEEILADVAWIEAELEFLGSPYQLGTPVLEQLGLSRDDYLVRK